MPEANAGNARKALQRTISALMPTDSDKSGASAVHAADHGAIASVMETVWDAWEMWANLAAAFATIALAASETAAAKTMASTTARTNEWRAQRDYLLLRLHGNHYPTLFAWTLVPGFLAVACIVFLVKEQALERKVN